MNRQSIVYCAVALALMAIGLAAGRLTAPIRFAEIEKHSVACVKVLPTGIIVYGPVDHPLKCWSGPVYFDDDIYQQRH